MDIIFQLNGSFETEAKYKLQNVGSFNDVSSIPANGEIVLLHANKSRFIVKERVFDMEHNVVYIFVSPYKDSLRDGGMSNAYYIR
jgi:hypothetical protein